VTRSIVLVLAVPAWLLIMRLPVDGLALFAVVAAWGILFGALIRHWAAGPALLAAALLGDFLAMQLGWFLFLADFWFAPAVTAGLAGLLGGALFQMRPWATVRRVSSRRSQTREHLSP
jgi:hypothetical protein